MTLEEKTSKLNIARLNIELIMAKSKGVLFPIIIGYRLQIAYYMQYMIILMTQKT